MSAMILDDNCVDTVLSFVRDVPPRLSCKKWARHIYKALMLESKILVQKCLYTSGSISFDYMASRDLGPEICESVAFHIDFNATGDYLLQFCHTLHEDLADVCVDVSGLWHVDMGVIVCETSKTPNVNLDGAVVGYSKTPVRFELPIELMLAGHATDESHPLRWEHSIRSRSLLLLDCSRKSEPKKHLDIPIEKEHDEAASSVAVEGRREPVCGDIRERRIQV